MPPDLPEDHDVCELRFALVCYGGVSLAIYMHGIAKELEKLVRASHRFVTGQAPGGGSEGVYYEALQRKADREGGVRTRVVVDIVSGTSAGGINGVCLAKAVAQDLEQGPLTRLWLGNASIGKLLRLALPPLNGNKMLGWIGTAFGEMEGTAQGTTLMPSGLSLDLFVTTTDLHGYPRHIRIASPPTVESVVNRIPIPFHYLDGVGDFGADAALGFAARASSSFPGAFPPAHIADISDLLTRESFASRFLEQYEPPFDANKTWFADGGILDNYPFRRAIQAIPGKPAATQTDRKLLFIEPDPAGALAPPDGQRPGFLRTIWSGLSTLPRRQPIADALDELDRYNRDVRRIKTMEAALRPQVIALVEPLLVRGWADANAAANGLAAASPLFQAYLRLKLLAVVERIALTLNGRLGYLEASQEALFVSAALEYWAGASGLLAAGPTLSEAQQSFLHTFDLDYGRRRLGFVIRRTSAHYATPEVGREQLNLLKHALYLLLCELRMALHRAGRPVQAAEKIFASAELEPYLHDWRVADFVEARRDELEDARAELAAALDAALEGFGDRSWERVAERTDPLPPEVRDDLRAHYVGFPLWDAATFPARRLADVVELDEVEVLRMSPLDSTRLRPPPPDWISRTLTTSAAIYRRLRRRPQKPPRAAAAKLRGVALGHFGGFFFRRWRENDYLWGRLDGAERLLTLLGETDDKAYEEVFRAVADEEWSGLASVRGLLRVARGGGA